MKLVKEIRSKEGVLHFQRYELFKTPWFICYLHKIKEVIKPTTSLFFVSVKNHEWGYQTETGFVGHEEYRIKKNIAK